MHAILEAVAGPAEGSTFELADDDIALVGRSPRCHFIIESDLHCSRVHFLLELRSPDCRLLDLGSTNGTVVNGRRVAEIAMQDGDEIRIGDTCLIISLATVSEEELEQEEPAVAPQDSAVEEDEEPQEAQPVLVPDSVVAEDSGSVATADAAPPVEGEDEEPASADETADEIETPSGPGMTEPPAAGDSPDTEETDASLEAPAAEEEAATDEHEALSAPSSAGDQDEAAEEVPPAEQADQESAPVDSAAAPVLEEPGDDGGDPPVEVFLATSPPGTDSSVFRCFRCGQAIDMVDAAAGDDVLICEECRGQLQTTPELVPGFRLEGSIRESDACAVWRAVEISTGRDVVVQIIVPDIAASRRAIRMFRRERVVLPRLRHENITECLAAGQFEGRMFIVVERFDGRNVTQLLEEEGGRLAAADTVSISLQVLEALHYAHHLRSVHRDIGPANILVRGHSPGFEIKVTGFGLARVLGATDKYRASMRGNLGEAIACMAPEQVLNCRGIDRRADIFGLGATMYYMLTGEFCYDFGIGEQDPLVTIIEEEVIPIEQRGVDLPSDLVKIINRAIHKDPDQRYASSREMGAALAGVDL